MDLLTRGGLTMYTCPRCGSTEFAIDEVETRTQSRLLEPTLEVICKNCGGYQGDLDVNVIVKGV